MAALLTVCALNVSAPPAFGQIDNRLTPGSHVIRLAHDGKDRAFILHIPRSASMPAPVVVALHGGGGNMNYMVRRDRFGLAAKSEEAGFVLVVPNGASRRASGAIATWNAGRCCAHARDVKSDDVGFIRVVLEEVALRMDIDRRRVFAVGMSNGGMMAYRLACDASDLFRGVAAVAGTDNTLRCEPDRPVAVLAIHAVNDDHVLFDGGAGPAAVAPWLITEYTSVPDTVAKWVRLNGASETAETVLDRPGARCERHEAGSGGAPVEFCVTQDGGHSWPGALARRRQSPSTAIDATDEMWRFFSGL